MLPDCSGNEKGTSNVDAQTSAELLLEKLGVNELPCSVFACDVPKEAFENETVKAEFEELFQSCRATNFIYLPSFRRVRVDFESPLNAAQARISLHEYSFRQQIIKIFFVQVHTDSEEESSDSLLPPKPEKLFLISPPASPPVGWEPIPESEPVINYGLLSAIATLAPGQAHELHPGTQSTPSVVLHACEEAENSGRPRLKIQQTRRPDA